MTSLNTKFFEVVCMFAVSFDQHEANGRKEVKAMAAFQSHQRTRQRSSVKPKQRRMIMYRDKRTCQLRTEVCTVEAEEIDHIVPYAEGGDDKLANLQAVCKACHKLKTQEEAARGRARFSRKRPPPPRPGSRNRRKNVDGFGWDCLN